MADRLRPPLVKNITLTPQQLEYSQNILLPANTQEKFNPFRQLRRTAESRMRGISHFAILAGIEGMGIAQEVGRILGKEVPINPDPFANNERRVIVPKDVVATRDVYVIQAVTDNPDAAVQHLKLLESGAKGVDANRIIAIFAFLPYSRQDISEQPGAPESARIVVQEILYAGSHNPRKKRHVSKLSADALFMAVDVHSEKPLKAIEKDSRYQWANLDSAYVLAPRVQQLIQEKGLDVVVGFPDHGARERYESYITRLTPGKSPAEIQKKRDIHTNNKTYIEGMKGDVAGKDVILVDDIIDTGGSITDAAKEFKKQGARSVLLVATHGIFSNSALEKMSDPAIDGVIVTDTIPPTPQVLAHPKIEVVSIAPLIAEAIRRMEDREPLGNVLKSSSKGFEHTYRRLTKINKYRRRAARDIRKVH